jgi:hypothetical protein
MSGIVVFNSKIFLSISVVFGGPYPGFTAPALPGETDKNLLVATHLKVFQEQVRFVSIQGTLILDAQGSPRTFGYPTKS